MCGGTPVIPSLGKLRSEGNELEASLDHLDLVSKKNVRASKASDGYLYGAQSRRALVVPDKNM